MRLRSTPYLGLIMAQKYSPKKGMKLFGDHAGKATLKKMKKFHDLDMYTPLGPKTLSAEEKRKALSALFFITEKWDGTIKRSKCAVGSKQLTYEGFNKADGALPTMSTDGLIIY